MNELPYESQDFKTITLKDAYTNEDHGKKPEERSIEEKLQFGIINIDKFSGPTSHEVSSFVKKILNIEKCGHSGTLDPAVTGVLPVALERGTKVLEYFLTAGKEYVCLMHFHKPVTKEEIKKTFKKFTGRIKQLPPIRSAVKRRQRWRKIYYNQILEIKGQDVLFRVGCQAGTYIRKLCHDMGDYLNVGANMVELRRTRVGPVNEGTITSLQELSDAFFFYKNENNPEPLNKIILNPEDYLDHIPKIWVLDGAISSLVNGVSLKIPGVVKFEHRFAKDDTIAVYSLKNELICFGRSLVHSKELKKSQKGEILKVEKVIMPNDTYPRLIPKKTNP